MIYNESETVELKQELTEGIKHEIIAFANTNGGTIYIGIADNGDIIGLNDLKKEEERVCSMIRDSISPDLAMSTSVSTISDDGKDILKIEVQSGSHKPYYLKKNGMKPSGVYTRLGTTSAQASEATIRQLIQHSDGTSFDKMRSLEQNLSFDYAEQFFEKSDLPFGKNEKQSLKLIDQYGMYTNAGLLFSDQCGHMIKCAVAGESASERFRAREEFTGSILKQLDNALHFLDLSNPLRSEIEGLYRKDTQSYPKVAIREALLNAVVHRDYHFSGAIMIHVTPTEMEIISHGAIPHGLSIKDIQSGVSECRNEVIAHIFYRLKLIEIYGTGIREIVKSYEDFSKNPEFIVNPNSFIVKLPNRNCVDNS